MTEQAIVQARVDKKLKQEVAAIYDSLGMDLPTAIRMFLVRSKMARGLPFEPRLPEEDTITTKEALAAYDALRQQASDVPELSQDQINAEISAIRAVRKNSVQ